MGGVAREQAVGRRKFVEALKSGTYDALCIRQPSGAEWTLGELFSQATRSPTLICWASEEAMSKKQMDNSGMITTNWREKDDGQPLAVHYRSPYLNGLVDLAAPP